MKKLFILIFFAVLSVKVFADSQKMNLDAPVSDKFLITDLVWPSTIGDAHVSLWDGDKVAAVTITIDDNIDGDHAWWLSMQQKYNLDFTWFIIINRVSNWSDYQTLIDAGNEIQAHDLEIDFQHCDLSEATDTKYITDMTLVRDTINQKLTNNKSLTLAYPCGQQREYLSRDLYIAMRGVTGTMNYANKTNYLDINSRSATNDVHDLDILLDPKETLWNKVFYRGLASYHYHKVMDKTATEEFLSAVRSKSDALWVAKFSEVARYGQERDSHTLTVNEVDANSIKFTLTDEMNDIYFDYPLTVKIRIDNNWKGISSTQNGKIVESKIVINNGNSYAIVKAIPDRGQVTVTVDDVDLTLPQAEAGADQVIVDVDNDGVEMIALDGSGSTDNDGAITTYKWFEAGTLLATGVQESITLPLGIHQIKLEVTDDSGKTATDEVVVTIEAVTTSEQTLTLLGESSDQEVYSGGNKNWIGQPSARVGGALSAQDAALILVYKLPELGTNKQIKAAALDVNLLKIANSPEGNVDLYGLGFRTSSTVLASDYYQGAYGADLTDATPLQEGFVTQASLSGSQVVNSKGQTNLASYINAQYQLGAKGGDYVFIRLNPDVADVSSYHYWEFSTADSDKVPVLTVTIGDAGLIALQAQAGTDQTVVDVDNDGVETIVLDGSGSTDSDGTITKYQWFEEGALLATGVQESVVLSLGVHKITLKVIDDSGSTATDEVTITIEQGVDSTPPQAQAGADQTIVDADNDGVETIVLDGTGSKDNDGTITTYKWFDAGELLATGVHADIVLPLGVHQITLEVTDDSGKTATDEVIITIEAMTTSEQTLKIVGEISDQEVYSGGTKQWVGQPTARVGGALSTQDAVFIMVYKLPVLGVDEQIKAATLDINLLNIANSPEGNIDLYGLGYSDNPTVLPSGYYQGTYGANLTDATPLQDNVVTQTSLAGWQTVDSTGQANLVSYINAQYQLGAKGGDYVFIRLNPDVADVSSYHYWDFSTANSDKVPVLTVTIGDAGLITLQAQAGIDQTVVDVDNDGVETIALDGSGSTDSDGTITMYKWFEAGELLATGVQADIILPLGIHQITLEVTDDSGKTATDEVVITIEAVTASEQTLTIVGEISDQEVYSAGTKKWVGQPTARVGGALSTQDAVFITVYKLPELGADEQIKAATLDINLLNIVNSPEGNIDLYGLGYSDNPTVFPSDYYQGAYEANLTDATPLQDNVVTQTSLAGWQTVDSTGQANLVSYINSQYQLGAKGGDYVFIRLNSDIVDVSSYHYWEFLTANSDQAPVLTITIDNINLI